MPFFLRSTTVIFCCLTTVFVALQAQAEKQEIKFFYAPIADHYAVMLAHYRFSKKMKDANFELQKLTTWDAARHAIELGGADMAAMISPLALKTFEAGPTIRWIGLAHRDGNALAVDNKLAALMNLPAAREQRKPNDSFIKGIKAWRAQGGAAPIIGVPNEYATHHLVLLKYLNDQRNMLKFSFEQPADDNDLLIKSVFPGKTIDFLKTETANGNAVAFEQSLPWADQVESQGLGKVVWYSKDVMREPKGHVECLIVANANSAKNKHEAVAETMHAIQDAAKELDTAIHGDGKALKEIAEILHREYVPEHSVEGIVRALDKNVEAINYRDLAVDKPGLKIIMDLAVQAKLLAGPVNLDAFADESFARH